jgi:hypothetical protein
MAGAIAGFFAFLWPPPSGPAPVWGNNKADKNKDKLQTPKPLAKNMTSCYLLQLEGQSIAAALLSNVSCLRVSASNYRGNTTLPAGSNPNS